jgi:hypothetical protein
MSDAERWRELSDGAIEFTLRRLRTAARGGRGPEARDEAQMTWNARGLNSFSAHEHFTFPTA